MIPSIKSVNHAAYRCRDVEQTRRFYEGVLGLKVKAALAFDQIPGTGFDRRYIHIFFEMADRMMFVIGRRGGAKTLTAWLDASILDDLDPSKRDPELGTYNLANPNHNLIGGICGSLQTGVNRSK